MAFSADQDVPYFEQLVGSALPYSVDFSAFFEGAGLTFSAATGTVTSGSSVSISSQTTVGSRWDAVITANSAGESKIDVVATPTSGSASRKRRIIINVTNP